MSTSPANEPGDVLLAAEERIIAAIASRDIAGLESELSDDFVHTTIGGVEQRRSAFLEAIRDMPYRILELRGESLQVRVLGDIAILSGVQRARVALPDGSVVTGANAFVDIFASTPAGWRLRHACSVDLPWDAQEGKIKAVSPDEELRKLCAEIVAESLTEPEWAERESDDMFQTGHYCGGFDADESAFCFSHSRDDGSEWWFQLTLDEVGRVARGEAVQLNARPAE